MDLRDQLYAGINILTILVGVWVTLHFVRLFQTTSGTESTIGVSIPSPDPVPVAVVMVVVLALTAVATRNLVSIYRSGDATVS